MVQKQQIPAFPKIFQLGDVRVGNIFEDGDDVEITEKMDGSQFSFGKIEGELQWRSKGVVGNESGNFAAGAQWVREIANTLPDNTVWHGELIPERKTNTLAYSRIPDAGFMLFGVRSFDWDNGTETMGKYSDLVYWSSVLQCGVVPLLHSGPFKPTGDTLIKMIKQESVLGGCDMEGIVVKNYNKGVEFNNKWYPLMSGKYVSESFKEKHTANPEYMGQKAKILELGLMLKTEARWRKAVQKLKETGGDYTGTVKDIGPLMKILHTDVFEEETDWIKDRLFGMFSKDLKKIFQGGFAEWYKESLLKENFGDDSETVGNSKEGD